MRRLLAAVFVCVAAAGAPTRAGEAPLRLAAPAALVGSGLLTHLLPRFRFRTRIRVEPVEGADAEARLAPGVGPALFFDAQGGYGLETLTRDPARARLVEALRGWLRSPAGRRAIEGFEVDGRPAFSARAVAVTVVRAAPVEGDAEAGARLALVHCGRCHVIDARNRMGGIGSTPSFAALRAKPSWREDFAGFHALNPHPAFTEIEGVTDPFPTSRPPPIAPIRLTRDEAQAIAAFAARLDPADLGNTVTAR